MRKLFSTKQFFKKTPYLAGSMAFIALSWLGVANLNPDNVHARVNGWNAGNIINDYVFTNKNAMNTSQIQNFLNSKVTSCDTNGTQPSEYGGGTRAQWAQAKYGQNKFVCLKSYTENGKSAAQIIYDSAQQYEINPQVLLVLLQKEQGLVTDTWPLNMQYRSATGYGCPDTAPCDSQYYGLSNQLRWAATMFRKIMNNVPQNEWYTPYVLGNNFIRYSPDASCGGTNVNIQNRATQALYNYTPYQPNEGALNADWGTSACGAYGNRNFYLYFTSWFGSTQELKMTWSEVSKGLYTDSSKTQAVDLNDVRKNQYLYAQVKVKNTSGSTWNRYTILGASGPTNRYSSFCTYDWIDPQKCNRMAYLQEDSVAPGEIGTYEYWMRAPDRPGFYQEGFNLLIEGLAWYVDIGGHWPINVVNQDVSHGASLSAASKSFLRPNDFVISPNGRNILTLTNQGNLIFISDQRLVWQSNTSGGSLLTLQSDGNLVLYNQNWDPLWVIGHADADRLEVKDDATLNFITKGSQIIWDQAYASKPVKSYPYFSPGSIMYRGQAIYSESNRSQLVLQGDGNLVSYRDGRPTWATNTANGLFLVQQGDGNFVLYNYQGSAIWSSNRSGVGVTTHIQDDGNLVSYGHRGPIWAAR